MKGGGDENEAFRHQRVRYDSQGHSLSYLCDTWAKGVWLQMAVLPNTSSLYENAPIFPFSRQS